MTEQEWPISSNKRYLTTRQAALMADWTQSGMNHLCRRGKVDCHKTDKGQWRIQEKSLLDYFSNRKANNHTNKKNLQSRIARDKRQRSVAISDGNTKLGKIPSFNILPVKSCTGSTPLCRRYCYARQSMQYSCQSQKAWTVNYFVARYHPAILEQRLSEYIADKKPVLFRIHSSGDFFSREYLELWYRVARSFPDTRFLAFTKNFTLDYSSKPDNLVVMYSVFPDTDYSKIPVDGNQKSFAVFPSDMEDKQYSADTQATIDNQRLTVPCPGSCLECGVCWYIDKVGKNVMFHIHGYIRRKAEKPVDPVDYDVKIPTEVVKQILK
jgi:hypothetical protein